MKLYLKLATIILLISSVNAEAATAYWTGSMEFVTTITNRQGVRCQYNYAGRTFWRTFSAGSCPSSVNVQ